MTDPAARARVERWMTERCPHIGPAEPDYPIDKRHCPDCLLALAQAEGFKVAVVDVTGDPAMLAENGRLKAELAQCRQAMTALHGLVEEACNGWAGALPWRDEVSRLVQQDRRAVEDLKRQADALLR